ncbi:MAG: serine--tRNA ligase [Bacteroidetes bacterium]|jgi:seryl-tRNA synthetase|nr:serine--tRNA ligase [Bacteroidota bacterium]MBT5528342.1 serine--tRNA ligase [Cytophagia bacterium]MBT3422231.1 serine--tRNA ligase [Bacteroidota bacterium]MBT3801174.1 serine--tRNA ligase [Bacteroidota bacterium]MBT3933088.1 serine--tRNA ligase [Bacteroidota bacterium]
MLTISQLEENTSEVIRLLAIKNIDAESKIKEILALDQARKSTQKENNEVQSELNSLAKEIGVLFRNKEVEKANELKLKTSSLKETAKKLQDDQLAIQDKIHSLIIELPNIPHNSVKAGLNEDDNELLEQHGEVFETDALPHWEIATKAGIIDFETGNKLTGAGFPVYIGKGAKLQRALISYFLDKASEQGFTEIQAPIMVNEESAYGTGQLPDKDGQMYFVNEDKLYLIPTAEVPLTNIYRDSIVAQDDLPIKLTGYTPCFRREAGSYGKNVRGLNRLHQFDKVEIVQITKPELSYQTLDEMVSYVGSLIKELELPYRIMRLCGKDLSFTAALTFDFEVYSAAQKRWLEVSSVSNFESFQASRLKLRYKDENNKNQLAHTLNGSALALPRILAAILENNQEGNHINIPKVLVKYTGFDKIEL